MTLLQNASRAHKVMTSRVSASIAFHPTSTVFDLVDVDCGDRHANNSHYYEDQIRNYGVSARTPNFQPMSLWAVDSVMGEHFHDVRVAAGVRHAAIARDRMIAGSIATEPELTPDLLFGAVAMPMLEQQFSTHLFDAWAANRSSLTPWKLIES